MSHSSVSIPLFWRLRTHFISQFIFNYLKNMLPPVSATEQAALDAGTVGWEGQLFTGTAQWQTLLDKPINQLSSQEQAFLTEQVETLCQQLNDWDVYQQQDLPEHVWQYLKEQGFFGMIIPKQYGGLQFSAFAHSEVIVKIASRCLPAAITVMVPNSLGPAKLLLSYGTTQQKDYYLPRLAKGLDIPAFALTSPPAGSDAASMQDQGVICYDNWQGKKILGIKLNWKKRYITLGPVATLLGVAFKLYDPEQLYSQKTELGITLALIPRTTPGVDIGKRHNPLHIGFQNGPNAGKDVFIPFDYIIGGSDYFGKGWTMLMECLADGRSISLPASSMAGAKMVTYSAGAYARIRKQFKVSLSQFGGIEEKLTRIAAYSYLMDATRHFILSALDQQEKPAVASAIVKYQLTEKMRIIVNDAMDIYGGAGICMGERNLLANIYTAIPISITVEGANILTRSLMIFGQGALRCHPYLYKEIRALQHTDQVQGLQDFDRILFQHLGYSIKNIFSSFIASLFSARLNTQIPISIQDKKLHYYYRQFARMSKGLALAADLSLLQLGGKIKRLENISARFADILSYLYMASALLHYYHHTAKHTDPVIVYWLAEHLLYNIQTAFFGLFANLPGQVMRRIIRFSLFPWGKTYQEPNDQLSSHVAQLITQPTSTREQLIKGIFISTDPNTATYRLQDALQKVIQAEVIEKKLRIAIKDKKIASHIPRSEQISLAVNAGILSHHDAQSLHAAEAARNDVIQVDDYPGKVK